MKKLLAFFLVVLSAIAFNRCNPYDTVPSSTLVPTTLTFTVGEGENTVTFNMVPVKAGTFQMGSNDGDDDEKPVHWVTLTQNYWMGEYEVTQGLWQAVMGNTVQDQRNLANPSWPLRGEGDAYPMYYVSWNEICNPSDGFLKKLNDATGMTFTLPTEEQWEFAAAGGKEGYDATGNRIHTYSGCDDTNINAFVWYKENSEDQTHPVGQMRPNELGIYDMSGNVWEWCADAVGSARVNRGGSWFSYADYCTVSYRNYILPDYRRHDLGFRLALLP